MASKKELKALITLAGKIDPSLQSAMLKATGESLKLSQNLKQSGKEMNRIGIIAKGTFLGSLAARGFTGLVSKVNEMRRESIALASDLNEVQNVVNTTFGESTEAINAWSKQALNAYGLSELQAKKFSGTMGAMLKSSGLANSDMLIMSQRLSGLAGDFASFYNLDHEEAFQKIRAGISGETEPLKQLGINMSVANLEAYALSKGIKTSWNQMDQATQTLLRYNYLMGVSSDAQGDFAKTSGEFANQQRLFDTNLKQFSATIAQKALPYLTKFFQSANKFMTTVDIDKYAAKAGKAFEYMGNAISWTRENADWLISVTIGLTSAIAAQSIVGSISKMYNAWTVATETQTAAQALLSLVSKAMPFGWIAAGIGLAVAAGVALYKNWDTIKAKAAELWESVEKYVAPIGKFFGFGDGNKFNLQASVSSMPAFASGGIATRPSIFGEAGPEMAIPLRRTPRSLGLLNQTAQMLGAPGGVSITYAPTIIGGNGQDVQKALGISFEEFKAWAEEYFEGKARVAYGQ